MVSASTVCAGISIVVDPATSFRDGAARVAATLTHTGREEARYVWIEAQVGIRRQQTAVHDVMRPGDVIRETLDLGAPPEPPGTHTVCLTVHYTDRNAHPFSAVHTVPLVTGAPPDGPPAAAIGLAAAAIRRRGTTVVTLANVSDAPLDGRLRLLLPRELSARPAGQEVTLAPHEGREIRVAIRNRNALPGSTYVVTAVFDRTTAQGTHGSVTTQAPLRIAPLDPWLPPLRTLLTVAGSVLLIVFLAMQYPPLRRAAAPWLRKRPRLYRPLTGSTADAALLLLMTAFIAIHLSPAALLSNTMPVGGDTPAHTYLADHLSTQFLNHGRIVSWAEGWWCGFPMFQFYFCLPYLLMALLDLLLPFNIAFKLVSISGMCLLPTAAYASARLMRLPRPGPLLTAAGTIPFLFDSAHTMWGVNAYSTLAGMIANSLSFPIMLIFLGCALRDAEAVRFRLRSALLFALLIASHFFTTIMAVLTLLLAPLLVRPSRMPRVAATLAAAGLLGAGLMAWWLVPLIARQPYAVGFGTNWDVNLLEALPRAWPLLFAGAVAALVVGIRQRLRFVALMLWMLLLAALLFRFGYGVSPVFVNVRLWPFITYALFALAAAGFAGILTRFSAAGIGAAALVCLTLVWGPDRPDEVQAWARWNYTGLEHKNYGPAFLDLVRRVDGTPGRLANDLHPDNNSLGSTRVFEAVPHLVDKPVLEGGLVNSAAGALFSYYIQGETSRECAGFPTRVTPTTFDLERGTDHLELFNVKHFIARWERTQAAMQASPRWREVAAADKWRLFELTSHDGSYVFVPERDPIAAIVGRHWKDAGLEWIYTHDCLDQPFLLVDRAQDAPPAMTSMAGDAFFALMAGVRDGTAEPLRSPRSDAPPPVIDEQEIGNRRIRFRTDAVGRPHIVRVTHYPNWRVSGADGPFRVTPCFMLVIPRQPQVTLYYGSLLSDHLGRTITFLGAILAAGLYAIRRHRGRAGAKCE